MVLHDRPLTMADYLIQYLNQDGVRICLKRGMEVKDVDYVAPDNWMDCWYDFLDQSEQRKMTSRGRAEQQIVMEMIP